MKETIRRLNQRLEEESIGFWYFQIETYFHGLDSEEITLIQLRNTDNETRLRIWHSELDTEAATDDFLYDTAMSEVNNMIDELQLVRKICRAEKISY